MNPEKLLKHFDRISEAPDAIPRLRRFIFDLAVRGKLVEQDPRDEPASELLRRIQAERERLLREARVNHVSPLSQVNLARTPFLIPRCWAWLQLKGIGVISGGMTPSMNRTEFWGGKINWFSPKDLKSDELIDSELKITRKGIEETGLRLYPPGCLLMVARSGILKRTFPVAINRVEATVNQDLKVLKPFVRGLERYLQIMFRGMTSFILSALVKTGTTVQSLKYEDFESQPVPLPPLAEQQRIVAKVDELMALCDRLAAAQVERESRRDRLAVAVHASLSSSSFPTPHSTFFINHLPRLTTKPEHIQQLRQTILNLAVQGKLVQQSSTDESSELFLSRIRKVQATAPIRSKKADVDDSDPKFIQHLPDVPPHNWIVCPLEDLFRFIDYRGRTPTRTTKGVRLITAKNVRMGHISEEPIEFVDEQIYSKWMTRGFPQNGDLLFVTEGATMGYVGAIELPFKFALAQRTIDLQPYLPGYSKFILFTMMSLVFQEAVLTNSTGTAVKGIKAAKLKRIRVLFPPSAEQQCIVAKVDELMILCDRLEKQLTISQTANRHFFEAALHEILEKGMDRRMALIVDNEPASCCSNSSMIRLMR